METGASFEDRVMREARTSRRAYRRRRLALALALFCPLAVVAAVASRAFGRSPYDAAVAALAAFVAAICGAVVSALLAVRGAPGPARVASLLDGAAAGDGLFAAAAHALGGFSGSRLAAVVLGRADRAVLVVPPLPVVGLPRWCGPRLLAWLAAAFVVAFLPGGKDGVLGGADRSRGGEAAEGPLPDAKGADLRRPADADDRRPELRESARLNLTAATKVLHENQELILGIELLTDRAVGVAVPLELVLAVSNGLPSPDEGFGVGWRTAKVPVEWSLPPAAPGRVMHLQPMLQALKDIGMPREGFITFLAAARVSDPFAPIQGGVLSNQVTVRFSPNVTKERTESPERPPEAKEGPKAKPSPKQEPKGDGTAKGAKPELGPPEPLPEVDTYASLVRPLFNEGPTVEKDVAIYDRETGGPGVMPPAPPPSTTPPVRTFERRPEAPSSRTPLSPAERKAVRDYFARLRGER